MALRRRENDLDTTIYHFGARTYNTAGQFWQQYSYPGQLTDPATTSRYAYAGANPISFTDLGGRYSDATGNHIGAVILTVGGFAFGTVVAIVGVSVAGGIALASTFFLAHLIVATGVYCCDSP